MWLQCTSLYGMNEEYESRIKMKPSTPEVSQLGDSFGSIHVLLVEKLVEQV